MTPFELSEIDRFQDRNRGFEDEDDYLLDYWED